MPRIPGTNLTCSDYVYQNSPELHRALGRLPGSVVQPDQGKASHGAVSNGPKGKKSLAAGKPVLRVHFISCRRAVITDDDNFKVGFKALRDSIAKSFGMDDRDSGPIQWEYSQVKTSGRQGTIVRIEWV